MNAFTESVALEVEPFGVRAHRVLPGRSPETRFVDNARPHMHGFEHEDYVDTVRRVPAGMEDASSPLTHARDATAAVWRAVADASAPLRIPAGADAEAWAAAAR